MTRGKGEGSVYKRASDGRWCGTVELPPRDGKRRRKTITSKNKADVVKQMRDLQQKYAIAGDLETSSVTLAQWLERWANEIMPVRVKPSARQFYEGHIRRNIIPAIGKYPLAKLRPEHVRALHKFILDKGLSSTSARGAHRTLSAALKDARRERLIFENVTELVTTPPTAVTAVAALDVDQAIKVIGTAVPELDGDGAYDYRPVLWSTFLLTGQRLGEVLGLEWDRITDAGIEMSWQLQRLTWQHGCGGACGAKRGGDCPKRRVVVPADYEHRQVSGGLFLVRPKSRAGYRMIPLVEPLRSMLTAHRTRAGINPHGLVFARADGQPLDPSQTTKEWAAWRDEQGITEQNVTVHGLRHTTIDLLLEADVPEDVVMEIVGHSNRAVTRGYKSKSKLARRTKALEQLAQKYMPHN